MTKRYLILGGGCSFAVHLSRYLLEQPETSAVVALGRSPRQPSCFTLGLDYDTPRYTYMQCDVRRGIGRIVQLVDELRPQNIINFAAEGESRASFEESWRYFETNCVAMTRLVEALHGHDYGRFVQVSTGEVYGSTDHPLRETEPTRPTSPYAASKAAFDAYLMSLVKKGTFRFNIVRPANTYGEGQQLHRFIPKAVLYGLTGRRIPLYGSGTGLKSYMHAQDLARAIYLLCQKAPLSRIYNIAPDAYVSMRDVADEIAHQLNMPRSSLCEDMGMRKGTDARYWFDNQAAERAFGFKTEIELKDGIARVIAWVRQNLNELSDLPTEYARAA